MNNGLAIDHDDEQEYEMSGSYSESDSLDSYN